MLSCRYMPMWMEGNLSSSGTMAHDLILQDFMAAPLSMQMDMHMIGVMYAPSNHLTLMVMGSYLSNNMQLRSRNGMEFSTACNGLGDISTTAMINVWKHKGQSLHAVTGLSIPTGDINHRDDTPMSTNVKLAYPMQTGSGTWDARLGATYLNNAPRFSWGVQASYLYRIGENSSNYTFGNKLDLVSWGALMISDFMSLSGSLSYYANGRIKGNDPDLNPMMMPLFNTVNSGRDQLDLGIGSNFYLPLGHSNDLRLGFEVKFPLIQSINGIQMKNDMVGMLGVQYTLGH